MLDGWTSPNASVIVLYGTSTAGKTTICNKLNEDGKLYVDGIDLAFDRLLPRRKEIYRECKQILGLEVNNPYLMMLLKISCIDYSKDIYYGTKENKNYWVSIINQSKEQIVEALNSIKSTLIKANSDNQQDLIRVGDTIEKLDIEKLAENLESFAKKATLLLQTLSIPFMDEIHRDIFDRAIESSKAGKPVVLDLVPIKGHDIINEFFSHLAKKKFQCPTYITLIHCPITKLSKRMEIRNKNARERGDLNDIRDKSFPFIQYTNIFHVTRKHTTLTRTYGTLTINEAAKAISRFSTSQETDRILTSLGFEATDNKALSLIITINPDIVYDTSQERSTDNIVKKLNNIITRESSRPTTIHPVAWCIKNYLLEKSCTEVNKLNSIGLNIKQNVTEISRCFNIIAKIALPLSQSLRIGERLYRIAPFRIKKGEDYFSYLPVELIVRVLSYLTESVLFHPETIVGLLDKLKNNRKLYKIDANELLNSPHQLSYLERLSQEREYGENNIEGAVERVI